MKFRSKFVVSVAVLASALFATNAQASGGTQGPDNKGSAIAGQAAMSIPTEALTEVIGTCLEDIVIEFIGQKSANGYDASTDFKVNHKFINNSDWVGNENRTQRDWMSVSFHGSISNPNTLTAPGCDFDISISQARYYTGHVKFVGSNLDSCPASLFSDKSKYFSFGTQQNGMANAEVQPSRTFDGSSVFGTDVGEHSLVSDIKIIQNDDGMKKTNIEFTSEIGRLIFSYPKEKFMTCLQRGVSELAGNSQK